MREFKLQYQHKSALLVIGLFLMSLMLPAYKNNVPHIPGIFDDNVTWGLGAFFESFFAVFVLSPAGLTQVALLVGVIALFRRRWKQAALCGGAAVLLAATAFQFYEPHAAPNTWSHMTGLDHSNMRITRLLSGFYLWWASGWVLAGAGLIGVWRVRHEELGAGAFLEAERNPVEVNRPKVGAGTWLTLGTIVLAMGLVFWEYQRFAPRSSDTVLLYYPRMSFRSPDGNSNFSSLVVNPPGWVPPEWRNSSRRDDMPDLYVRLDGATVLFIPDLTREDVEKHFERPTPKKPVTEEPAQAAKDRPGEEGKHELVESDYFVRIYQQRTVVGLYYREHQALSFRFGDEDGGVFDPELEIGSRPDGPFYRFPLSRKQIVELFGKPTKVETIPNRPSSVPQ